MEMLVTLILRLYSVASESTLVSNAINLLKKACTISFKWISLLRVEIHGAADADISQRCSRYSFWAALLWRRTFIIHVENSEVLQSIAFYCFIECSVALQDNLVSDSAALPLLLKSALIRDLKMVYRLRYLLCESLEASTGILMSAVNTVCSEPEGDLSRSSPRPNFLPHPNKWWTELVMNPTLQIK